jgi:hypothetical protein
VSKLVGYVLGSVMRRRATPMQFALVLARVPVSMADAMEDGFYRY